MLHIPGGVNLILILAIALIVFGPQKLPEIARTVAKTMNELRNAMHDVTQHFDLNNPGGGTRIHPGSDPSLADAHYSSPAYYGRPSEPHYGDDYSGASAGGHSSDQAALAPGDNQSLNIG